MSRLEAIGIVVEGILWAGQTSPVWRGGEYGRLYLLSCDNFQLKALDAIAVLLVGAASTHPDIRNLPTAGNTYGEAVSRVTCPNCGGTLVGDGYRVAIHCEFVDLPVDREPDSKPIYCEPNR